MTALTWTDTLALQQPQMDATHREFVDLLAGVEQALGADAPALAEALDRFARHTEAHFGQEDEWLQRIGFADDSCHANQHAEVLELVHEVQRRLREQGDTALVQRLVPALAQWFPIHAQTMDAGLAEAMKATGYDVATGSMARPPDAPGGDVACEHLREGAGLA